MAKPSIEARSAAMKRRARPASRPGVIPAQGGRPAIHFKPGALHSQLGVPQGRKIPAGKMRAAISGARGPLAQRRARFARNVLGAGR